ncbi:aldehyde dehydrogenase family protein (plasmid) [Rathayibacter sp. VKM Ac-2803]|uniref:Succinic semialdehyde dehydrogenase n=1 Tax=Rathayibacter caricis DSM 15933 TaxID=1328867 RepID=A0A2T4UNS6_9MICO|nr:MULTISPECIES: succinic semialdehyde dehydrogenase [Rathayibacter]MWV51351.1 aldehyde dehydrogenase family protein [Rathayibacter sp. VKM Ac-2803]PTL71188.1 succinic semialdehyde dehydrogenase [Rathayibacter caricis DSM 15933]
MSTDAPASTSSRRRGDDDIAVHSPFNGCLVGHLPRTSIAGVDAAFIVAKNAQLSWAERPLSERELVARRFATLVLRNRDQLLDLIQLETGKNRASAFEEIADVSRWASYLGHNAGKVLSDRRRRGLFPFLTHVTERRVPKGVVGVITPWNYPFTLPASDVLPALVAGNAVVLKPDIQTPHTALRMAALLRESGIPDDLLHVVVGDGAEIGGAIVARADYVMFTGSTETGRKIAQQCAGRLVGFSAELGGKNPMLVLRDADVERAAAGAVRACFSNTGQLCVSVERIYVHDDRWEQFISAFGQNVRAMRVGPGLAWGVDMGSLISARQLATVSAHVDDAIAHGAQLIVGGRARPDLGPYFYEPTVLTGVTEQMVIAREETFGPVVSVYRVASDAEAVDRANDSSYGLNASVWSRGRGDSTARTVEAGTVNVNDGYAPTWASHDAPMGGMKTSGLGRRHGAEGVLKYTEAQTIARQRLIPAGGPRGFGDERWARLLTFAVRILNRIN